jgi:hypothetical protein
MNREKILMGREKNLMHRFFLLNFNLNLFLVLIK